MCHRYPFPCSGSSGEVQPSGAYGGKTNPGQGLTGRYSGFQYWIHTQNMYTLLCSQYIFFTMVDARTKTWCILNYVWSSIIEKYTYRCVLDHVPDIWFKHHWAGAGCGWVIQTTSRVSKRGWTKAAFSYWEIICWGIFISNGFLVGCNSAESFPNTKQHLRRWPFTLAGSKKLMKQQIPKLILWPMNMPLELMVMMALVGVHQVVMVGVRMVFRSRARGRASTSQFQSQNQAKSGWGSKGKDPTAESPCRFLDDLLVVCTYNVWGCWQSPANLAPLIPILFAKFLQSQIHSSAKAMTSANSNLLEISQLGIKLTKGGVSLGSNGSSPNLPLSSWYCMHS